MTTALTLTDPMRTCSVSTEIIKAATDINTLLESADLNHIVDVNKMVDGIKYLKQLAANIDDARKDPFRPIDNLRSELKEQIDNLILKPINAKIAEYQKAIDAHNEKARQLEIEKAKQLTSSTPVSIPIKTIEPIQQRKGNWTYEVIDEIALPERFKRIVPNHDMLKSAVRSGIRQIRGVRIYQK